MGKMDWNPEVVEYRIVLKTWNDGYSVGLTMHNASDRELQAPHAARDRKFTLEQVMEWAKLRVAQDKVSSDDEWDALEVKATELLRSVGRVPRS